MKPRHRSGAALIILLALTSTLATTASAATIPNILPTATAAKPVTADTSSGKSEWGNGLLHVTAESSTGTQTGTSTKLGTFSTTYKQLKDTLGRTCTGLTSKEGSGEFVSEGTFHIRDYKNFAGELKTAYILLQKEAHFECGTLLILLRGCLAGALTPEKSKTKALSVTFEKNGSTNDNIIITVLNEENTSSEACQWLSKTDEGAFELTSQRQTIEVKEFKQGGAAVEVEVMPL